MGTSTSGAPFHVASDQSLLIYFGRREEANAGRAEIRPLQNPISSEAHQSVRKMLRLLEREPIGVVRNIHPGYDSILIQFDPLKSRHAELQEILRKYLVRIEDVQLPAARLVEIPVCYGGEFGADLGDVAAMRGIKAEQVIELHASREYNVYFLGFVPGFAYLGELPEALATPRLATPRKKVPAGSVGIAGRQTGVYPFATPGGWRLLGRTPLAMFRPDREGMSLLAIGDRVRFVGISREEFAALERG